MGRAIWKGMLTFGMVSVPVGLQTATDDKSVKFKMLHRDDGGQIRFKKVCEGCGDEIGVTDIVKGYSYASDQFVTFEDHELERGLSSKIIDVEVTVGVDEIDPIYFQKPYYLVPDKGAEKAYALLAAALEVEDVVGITRLVMRQKEYLAAVRPLNGVLVVSTMRWPDEIRQAPGISGVTASDKELHFAQELVQMMRVEFDPDMYTDEYRNRVEELVERKVAGEVIELPVDAETHGDQVADLMGQLKASIEAGKKKRPAKKTTAKKPAAKKITKKPAAKKTVRKKAS